MDGSISAAASTMAAKAVSYEQLAQQLEVLQAELASLRAMQAPGHNGRRQLKEVQDDSAVAGLIEELLQ